MARYKLISKISLALALMISGFPGHCSRADTSGTLTSIELDRDRYKIRSILHEDFASPDWHERWAVEGNSVVEVRDGRLWITRSEEAPTTCAATVWYRQELPQNVLVRFRAKVLPPAEGNYANLNLLLHACEANGDELRLGRSGAYAEYHKIPNYIVTFVGGAARDGWSRARRDPGFEILNEAEVRSEVGREYEIAVSFVNDTLRYYLDGSKIHEVMDPAPHRGGKFGLRTFRTDGWWDDVEFAEVLSIDPTADETNQVDESVTTSPLQIEGVQRHPTVNASPETVEWARKQVKQDAEVARWFGQIKERSLPYRDKTEEWVADLMPEPGACFAMGYIGCPICGGSWHEGNWLRVRASLDKPGVVVCDNGHALPDEKHPDTGKGYTAPDGRIHYFVGTYNSFLVETLSYSAAEPFSFQWLLEDDAEAGRMAVIILDHLARIYPGSTKGAWDYPSNNPTGRLNRPNYQASRALVRYIDMYDRLYHHPAMEEGSAVAGISRRENIEKNLILDGAAYCYDTALKMGGLHNGQADYVRGALAAGVALGIPHYVRWAAEGRYGIRAMIANNLDRDGQYFESSAGYALHTRNLYQTFTEPLYHYRGSAYPDGLNLYDDPKLQAFLLLPMGSMACLGHPPAFGDIVPRLEPVSAPDQAAPEDIAFAELLAKRVSDPALQGKYTDVVAHLLSTRPNGHSGRVTPARVFYGIERPLKPTASVLAPKFDQLLKGSHFYGQKGVAILRNGEGDAAHAALLRFGPALVHGHMDDLNVNYYAQGQELTYDLGYKLGSTHTQNGWADKTIAHNTLVVDEQEQGGGMFGGSLLQFAVFPQVKLVEGSSMAYAHRGVIGYRRLFVLAPEYALDLFRTKGGRLHDLPLHSRSQDVEFEGIEFDKPRDGSLAGPEYRWSELQLSDGDMQGHPNKPYWNPPPGNGYGFLMSPAWADPQSSWSAVWRWNDKAGTRFGMLALDDRDTSVVTAWAPGINAEFPKARYVIRRRAGNGLESCFAAIWQSWTEAAPRPVVAAFRMNLTAQGDREIERHAAAVRVELAAGVTDTWMFGGERRQSMIADVAETSATWDGAVAHWRVREAELESLALLDGTHWESNGWSVHLPAPRTGGTVRRIEENPTVVEVEWDGPPPLARAGDPIYFSNPAWSRNSVYIIREISGNRIALEQATTRLGIGEMTATSGTQQLISEIVHEYSRSVRWDGIPTGFFRGKVIRAVDGGASSVVDGISFSTKRVTIDVDSIDGWSVGDKFEYHDLQPGDRVEVHHYALLEKEGKSRYRLKSNCHAEVVAPPGYRVMPQK